MLPTPEETGLGTCIARFVPNLNDLLIVVQTTDSLRENTEENLSGALWCVHALHTKMHICLPDAQSFMNALLLSGMAWCDRAREAASDTLVANPRYTAR